MDDNDENDYNINGNNLYQSSCIVVVKNDVKIVGLNVCGIKSKLRNGIFEEFAKQYDILCLSETKVGQIDLTGTSLSNDYTSFCKEKSISKHRYGGVHGLGMIVKNSIAIYAQLLTVRSLGKIP